MRHYGPRLTPEAPHLCIAEVATNAGIRCTPRQCQSARYYGDLCRIHAMMVRQGRPVPIPADDAPADAVER